MLALNEYFHYIHQNISVNLPQIAAHLVLFEIIKSVSIYIVL